jgi:hypothetical protein
MGHLTPEQIAPLAAHPTLRRARLGLGSYKKNNAARAVLPLPDADTSWDHPALNPP